LKTNLPVQPESFLNFPIAKFSGYIQIVLLHLDDLTTQDT
jgi:hypothetical protein